MADWKADELDVIARASELEVAALQPDGTLRDSVTIWVVRVGDDLFVRSVRGSAGSWYQGSQQRHEGRVAAGGVERDVKFVEADHGLDDEIDTAYKEKYGYPSSAVDHITSPEARATTLRLVPRWMPPTLKLNNDAELPALGFGVFQTPPEETTSAVAEALRVGYRHVDTAAAYGNEREVGEGIRRSDIDREEVFIETKVWISDYGYEAALHAFDKSAGKLEVEQLDLLILHQPLPSEFDLTLDAYRALERLLGDGKVRAIGVSNFMPEHLRRLLAETSVVPAVNQIELHPYFQQTELQRLHEEHGILTQAWSPIGGITSYRDAERSVFEDPTLLEIGRAHEKSAAQVMLRWHLQQGRSAIPKSTKPGRIAENFDVFDFELSSEQIVAIDALDTGVRGGPDPDSITLEGFGKEIPEA